MYTILSYLQPSIFSAKSANVGITYTRSAYTKIVSIKNACIKNTYIWGTYIGNASAIEHLGVNLQSSQILELK